MSTRILVTGGAGFIGSHCVDWLLQNGHQVVVFDKKPKEQAVNLEHSLDQVSYQAADLSDTDALQAAMTDCDAVIHLAAFVSVPGSIEFPAASFADNVVGTCNVFECMRSLGIKKGVYASSAAVYGNPSIVPTPESAVRIPLAPYGLHKKQNEDWAQMYADQYGLKLTGLRFFNVYGNRQDPASSYSGVISIFFDRIQNNQMITVNGDGEATRDFVYVKDAAAVCCRTALGDIEIPTVCNIGTGKSTSLNELIKTISEVTGKPAQITTAPARDGDIEHSCADVTGFKKIIAKTTDLHAGLTQMMSD